MCRIAAYVGPPVPLSALLYDPDHSLERQAYVPRELVNGTVNVDGTGVAWWAGDSAEPIRYASTESPWADANLTGLANRISSGAILAAVRSATPGLAFGPDHVAPFTSGRLAGAHNGWIERFREGVGRDIVSDLPDEQWGELGVLNDSKALFMMVAGRYEGDLTAAVQEALRAVRSQLDEHGVAATLNLVVADGDEIVAARHSVRAPHNSLYAASREGAHLVASEPLDAGAEWKPVPESHLAAVTRESIRTIPVE